MGCCECTGDLAQQEWLIWHDHPINNHYKVVMDLGEGAFAQTVLGVHRVTQQQVALKVVFLCSPDADNEHRKMLKGERDLLMMVRECPFIVDLYDTMDNGKQMVLVLEYLRGGQLLDHLHRIGEFYTEQQAAIIFGQLASAVYELHRKNIVHRDIKGENVMFVTDPQQLMQQGKRPQVKLVDLGMGALYDPDNPLPTGPLGSAGFVAPEVALGDVHTPAMDVFSMGVLLFVMLVGRKPWNFSQVSKLQYATLKLSQAVGLKDPRWMDLSPAAKELVLGMLRYDPRRRLTSKEVVEHDWIRSEGGQQMRPLDISVSWGAANVAALRRLKNMVHGVVAVNRINGMATQSQLEEYANKMRRMRRRKAAQHGQLSLADRVALKVSRTSFKMLHDTGRITHPDNDISMRLRGCHDFSMHGSVHSCGDASWLGGSRHVGGTAGPAMLRDLDACAPPPRVSSRVVVGGAMKKSSSAVLLSEMVRNGSLEDLTSAATKEMPKTDQSGSTRGATMWSLMRSSIRGLYDASLRGSSTGGSRHGSMHAGGSRNAGSRHGGSRHGGSRHGNSVHVGGWQGALVQGGGMWTTSSSTELPRHSDAGFVGFAKAGGCLRGGGSIQAEPLVPGGGSVRQGTNGSVKSDAGLGNGRVVLQEQDRSRFGPLPTAQLPHPIIGVPTTQHNAACDEVQHEAQQQRPAASSQSLQRLSTPVHRQLPHSLHTSCPPPCAAPAWPVVSGGALEEDVQLGGPGSTDGAELGGTSGRLLAVRSVPRPSADRNPPADSPLYAAYFSASGEHIAIGEVSTPGQHASRDERISCEETRVSQDQHGQCDTRVSPEGRRVSCDARISGGRSSFQAERVSHEGRRVSCDVRTSRDRSISQDGCVSRSRDQSQQRRAAGNGVADGGSSGCKMVAVAMRPLQLENNTLC